jgi:hypothetical protein
MEGTPRSLPPAAAFVLTRRIPCTALALVMFSAIMWLPGLLAGAPVLAALATIAGMAVHLMVPALFALILLGGGFAYALQVALLSTVAVIALGGGNFSGGVLFLVLYALLPIMAARALQRQEGVSHAARQIGTAIFMAVAATLVAGAVSKGVPLHALVDQLVAPLFAQAGTAPDGQQMPAEVERQIRVFLGWALPGILGFSLWLTWWLNLLLGRHVAVLHGFYRGDTASWLKLRMGRITGIAFVVAMIFGNLAGGSLQYMGITAGIILAGMLAVQGVAIAHTWLKVRNMQVVIVMMYLILLMWSMMMLPFIILGLLDIWFDYRRNMEPATGGK